ncbi:AAA family ATPase [Poseidonocella sp. HB161398]|uniref:ATP-binding protein n=1 Tax=Poseidonocella sp. HB161398 TaxID=2320855 RepID=UPI0014860580|nr:AAA family ATPase [Poseidonocella sp. HB161398]
MTRPSMRSVLDRAGLAAFEDSFRAEHIDEELFWTLGDADLRELGLTLGQRKRLLAAIDALRGTLTVAPESLPDGLEMRRLTVIFADMIGSTRLTETLSPDDLHALFQSFYLAAGGVARRFGGYLASLHGDGAIMLFGYPRTRLGDAERGLGAALALQEALAAREVALPSGQRIKPGFRVGIATGEAVIGRPEEHNGNERLHMVGKVMHRSARLQSVSPPGGVMADAATRAQGGGQFEFEDATGLELPGFEEAGQIYRVLGRARGQAAGGAGGRALGRGGEVKALIGHWQGACAAEPAMVVVTGEAGLGKTTLLRTAAGQIGEEEAELRWLSCSSLTQNSAFAPVTGFFEQLVGGEAAGTAGARRDALAHALEGCSPEEVGLVAELIGLAPRAQSPGPKTREARAGLIALLADWFVGSRDGRPVLLVLEDAHWCDATTRDLLEEIARRAAGRPVMLLASSRNRAEPLWQGQPGAGRLALAGLGPRDAAELFRRTLGGNPLPEAVTQRMLTLAEGNPLMLESLARAMEGDRIGSIARDVAVPRTLYESVGERLDQLGGGRPVAAALAVFDMPADQEMLAGVAGISAEELDQGLAELMASGLVAEEGAGGSYRFHHHLYRDVVYERLVGLQRRSLHAAALDILRGLSADMAARHPDMLATHALAAGLMAEAAPLALAAAEQFLAGSALVEANHYFDQALEALGNLGDSEATKRLRMRAASGLAVVKRGRFSIGDPEVGRLSREMLALARDLGDGEAELLALNGIYSNALVAADYAGAKVWAQQLAETAEARGNRTYAMIGRRGLGSVALHTGRFADAERELSAAFAAYDMATDLNFAFTHGYDNAEICAVFLSFTRWLSGDLQRGRESSSFAVSHAERIRHGHSLGMALAFQSMLAAMAVDDAELLAGADQALSVAERYDIKVARGAGNFFGRCARLIGREAPPTPAEAARARELMVAFREYNPLNYGALSAGFVAWIHLRAGETAEAERLLEEARSLEKSTGETWYEAETSRLEACLAAARGRVEEAAALRRAALAQAREMGAATIALRIACDMAEAAPGAEARACLEACAAAMVSLDDGWDVRRMQRLLAGEADGLKRA